MDNSKMFKQKGYCIVRSAITEELRDFVTQYALFDEMQNFSSELDNQTKNAHSKYGDAAMETMLLHLHPIIEQNTGLKVYPTYSYYRVYRNQEELKKHKDRESCEISCTLCFNYSYNDAEYQWPIYMAGNPVTLNPGDLVIYRGCDLDHWREKFSIEEDAWHVQGFFHYVDRNGPYADFKFDNRETIGELKNFKNNTQRTEKSYIQYTG